MGSHFSDAPQRGDGNGFNFSTYLTARNITAPGDKKSVGILAGFTWTYTGTGDASTYGGAIAVGAADATLINNAMGNAAPANSFPGWSATTDFQLLPCATPSAWDYVWSDGLHPVLWSPGSWTRDNVEIGQTFPGGVTQPPGQPSHLSDHITLPAPPNDFHFSVFLPDSNTNESVWYKYPALTPFDYTFQVFTLPEINQMMMMYDFGANMLQITNMMDPTNPIYSGPIDGFNAALFGGQYTGDMRHDMLMFLAPLAGDYNGNGVVDAADYVLWRDTLGSATNLSADGNGNGMIDSGDYDIWREHFGQTAGISTGVGASAAVPEPATVLMLLAGMLMMCSRCSAVGQFKVN